jgi:hypothetical protein
MVESLRDRRSQDLKNKRLWSSITVGLLKIGGTDKVETRDIQLNCRMRKNESFWSGLL